MSAGHPAGRIPALTLALLLFVVPALADKAPAAQALGSTQAAGHLLTHLYARTDGWDGVPPAHCEDETCEDYGHIHCYGRRVSLWDTPAKGDSRVAYYPGGLVGRIGPDTELELIGVVTYEGQAYANLRVYEDGRAVLSGFVNADYIGCDCDESYAGFEDVSEYVHDVGAFSLK